MFNLITGAVALLRPWLIGALGQAREVLDLPPDPATKLALFHTTFNLLGVLLMWPLAERLTRWLQQRFRAREDDEAQPQFLDDNVRSAQRESAAAFEVLATASPWRHLGWLGVIVAAMILAYCGVIAGWVLKYLWLHLPGSAPGLASGAFLSAFRDFTAHPVEPIAWQFAPMLSTMAIVVADVERGIERTSKWLMPALGLLMRVRAGLILGGSIFMLGASASLGYGPWTGLTFLGWVWRRRDALIACGLSAGHLGPLWRFSWRCVVPLLVLLLVLAQGVLTT